MTAPVAASALPPVQAGPVVPTGRPAAASGPLAPAACRLARRAALALAGGVAMLAACVASTSAQVPDSFADLAERLLPAVVNISTTQAAGRPGSPMPEFEFPPGSPFEEFFDDFFEQQPGDMPPRRATSLGSGFIIEGNYVVTNNHVIEGADEITVILQDDTNLPATVVGRDDKTDLALLRLDADLDLPTVPWGDSGEMRVGDWVIAIGNPFGLGGTVTAGIISAIARDINAGPYDDFIQTDASINRGNSGGPMFNLDGEVIGINTAIFSPSGGSVGIGFAIPSALGRQVIEQIQEYGRTRRGWLGVRIQTVTDEIAENLGLEEARGALVASVNPDGPAAEAGVRQGDVIVAFDGQPIPEMRALPRIVAATAVDKEVTVEVFRRGESVMLTVTLGELEAAEEEGLLASGPRPPETDGPMTLETLGLTLSPMTEALRQEYDLSVVDGVVVTQVDSGSAAAEKGMIPGEVLVEVSQQPVTQPAEVAALVEQAREANQRTVLVLIDRQGDLRFVALSIAD
jgi:serine protease Do